MADWQQASWHKKRDFLSQRSLSFVIERPPETDSFSRTHLSRHLAIENARRFLTKLCLIRDEAIPEDLEFLSSIELPMEVLKAGHGNFCSTY